MRYDKMYMYGRIIYGIQVYYNTVEYETWF